jgi:hypothetical protein
VTASVIAVPLASQEIVVSPRSDAAFVKEVSQALDAQLDRVRFSPRSSSTGIAKVRFVADEYGRPAKISLYERSGSSDLDRAAKRAVSGLTNLSPLEYGAHDDRVIQANIVVASSEAQMERLMRKLQRDEAARIASARSERAVLAMTVAPRKAS